jgi:hypothetical protein
VQARSCPGRVLLIVLPGATVLISSDSGAWQVEKSFNLLWPVAPGYELDALDGFDTVPT